MLSYSQAPFPRIATMGPQCSKEGRKVVLLAQAEPKESVKTQRGYS